MPIKRALLIAVALLAATSVCAPASVPPRDCGFLVVKSHRYQAKADQLRCKVGRRYVRAYLKNKRKPKGYSCKEFGPETPVEFLCKKGKSPNEKQFLAVRHS